MARLSISIRFTKMKRFITDCVGCPGPNPGEAIRAMVDNARSITRRTFLRHVSRRDLEIFEKELNYEGHPSQGMTMAQDWHVGYYKSVFREKPVVYFCHSAIEYIFA